MVQPTMPNASAPLAVTAVDPALASRSPNADAPMAVVLVDGLTGLPVDPAQAEAFAAGQPTARALSLSHAFQAADPSHPALITLNLASTAGLTLGGGTTNTASVVVGPTNAVAGGAGTEVGRYSNSLTGTLVIGVALSSVSAAPVSFVLPAGWYFAVIPIAGTVTIGAAFDQSLG